MTQINDDINSLDTISDNYVKMLATYFYKHLKEIGYYPHINIPQKKTKRSIHFYQKRDDYEKILAPYSITINDNDVLFYFRKTSNLSVSHFQELQNDFGSDKVEEKDGLQKNLSYKDKATVRIDNINDADLLINNILNRNVLKMPQN